MTENTPIEYYGPWDGDYAMFERRCPKCGRFVKPDKKSNAEEVGSGGKTPNAACSRCGRVRMLFLGFTEIEEA